MKTIKLGTFGVDSGQVLIVDPCYLDKWKDGEVNFDVDGYENSYDEACKLTTEVNQFGGRHSIGGVVSETGLGDGEYEVEAVISDDKDFGKRVKEIRIKFF